MIDVLDLGIDPDYRYLAPEIDRLLPAESSYRAFVDDPTPPTLDGSEGVVLSGSTASVYDGEHADWVEPATGIVERCLDEEIPLLGVCFGHQLVHDVLGGTVRKDRRRATFVDMEHDGSGVLAGVKGTVPVLHADRVVETGDGLTSTASTDYDRNFCSVHEDAPIWTVQFHPEFTERVVDRPSDWEGGRDFAKSNATLVLDNFADACSN
ncbi:MAG: gamma-glutamyl-gamma-aminobutyrate hydrolase family protein [Natronomonas sp.]|uniref:type 1 glutamine amidotransferase n=1 Tax=Natronomonas sp. TaxID=2184060 RepID=UPI0028706FF9|nr:gamma-glutamyl-gamma-aminobutyrate hydrolase family protein [Natronomonas sp.]MDR9432125.1 gamma-glutamyl-gamma-aminobutyrate hydrolase family protein [Natronomonas sp.]